MKIDDIRSKTVPSETNYGQLKKVNNKTNSFAKELKTIEKDKLIDKLKELITKMGDLGQKLTEKMDLSTLKEYKKTIKEMLSITIYSSHEYYREYLLDRKGRHKTFGIIKKIDETMDKLTQEIIKNEKDSIKILSYIDEIKGLIVDLFM